MKKLICNILLLSAMAGGFASCSDDADNSWWDDIFAQKYNQQLKWNPDSLALTRATWDENDLDCGAKMASTSLQMWGVQQSLRKLTYSQSLFMTHIAANDNDATLDRVTDEDASFAVNGFEPDLLVIDGKVITEKSAASDGSAAFVIASDATGEICDVIASAPQFYSIMKERYTTILAGGTHLVTQGAVLPQADSQRTAHTIIGKTRNGQLVMLFIDKDASAAGATLAEAALIAQVQGMTEAMTLTDNTALWLKEKNEQAVKAAKTVIYGVFNTPFASGEGTEDSPYVIKLPRHINNMLSVLSPEHPVYFELGADIDMSSIEGWVPLNQADPFDCAIYFDGKGYTISNFHCDYKNYPSFFGVLYGQCRNVKFHKPVITNTSNSACGVVGGYIGTVGKPGLVEQVAITEGNLSTGVQYTPKMGGVAGYACEGTVRNTYADVTLVCQKAQWNVGCGGIIGQFKANATVEYCYATGSIDAIKYNTVGGIWGYADNNLGWTLRNNIGWMSSLTGAWASNRVGGRTKYDSGNTLGTNYGRRDCVLTLFENDNPSPAYTEAYKGRVGDQSIEGTLSDNIIDAAKALGWDETIWDLSGTMPKLRWE
ncbi:MAG: phosphodiester glycosidase family protein [Muribaculaceae bacterium]|nr:phosphodiester glycosidase family protein [Bacteroidales bacterium]MDY4810492.1 phosphodiester glycosidase family protein [Muribaculaceae bacterium]